MFLIYQMTNLHIAQTVLSFTVLCPILVGLIRMRWAEWAVEVQSGLAMAYALENKAGSV
jgi:hypothetical protein